MKSFPKNVRITAYGLLQILAKTVLNQVIYITETKQ